MLTEATRGEGVPELWACIEEHRAFLAETGELERRRSRNLANEVFALASARAKEHSWAPSRATLSWRACSLP